MTDLSDSTNQTAPDHWTVIDRQMMSLALSLAQKGQYTARPNPMVGCVLTQNDQIIAQGWHQKSGQAHAEVNALAQAGEMARGATCYVSLEPCAHRGKTGPCAEALIAAGVRKVIAAMQDPNPEVSGKGFERLRQAGIQVECGLYRAQAMQLNRGFISRIIRNRPWVTCKLAMSLDGRTALANGQSKWITGEAARFDVQKLRARQDAIITGIGTVMADDPSLNVRAEGQSWFEQAKILGFNQPARVLLDRQKKADVSAKIFNPDAPRFWISDLFQADNHSLNDSHLLTDENLAVAEIKKLATFTQLEMLLEYLAVQGMNNVLLEAGHRLAGEFLRLGLIDELVVFMAPKLMGDHAMGLFDFELPEMARAPKLKLIDIRQFDDDIRFTYQLSSTFDPLNV